MLSRLIKEHGYLEGNLHAEHKPGTLAAAYAQLECPGGDHRSRLGLTAIIVADTWEWFPLTMLMVLVALQTLPDELIDAAHVDGAGP
jgi:ABC-type sugar transport system permease subunit